MGSLTPSSHLPGAGGSVCHGGGLTPGLVPSRCGTPASPLQDRAPWGACLKLLGGRSSTWVRWALGCSNVFGTSWPKIPSRNTHRVQSEPRPVWSMLCASLTPLCSLKVRRLQVFLLEGDPQPAGVGDSPMQGPCFCVRFPELQFAHSNIHAL